MAKSGSVGWERIITITILSTAFIIVIDQLGIVDATARLVFGRSA